METSDTFNINVPFLEGREPLELLVIPSEFSDKSGFTESYFDVILDGVHLATLSKNENDSWVQEMGNLEQDSIDKIGDGIDQHLK